jgi:hypothetical protein
MLEKLFPALSVILKSKTWKLPILNLWRVPIAVRGILTVSDHRGTVRSLPG